MRRDYNRFRMVGMSHEEALDLALALQEGRRYLATKRALPRVPLKHPFD